MMKNMLTRSAKLLCCDAQNLLLLVILLAGSNIGAQDQGDWKWPLVLSPDERYLTDQKGQPFFIQAEAA
jgi:hypothetical protein